MPLYPMHVEMSGQRCLVVGGGRVAERRIAALLDAGAAVQVVSPKVTETISRWIGEGRIEGRIGTYRAEDMEAASFVFAATDDGRLNREIYEDAIAKNCMVNVADRADLSRFFVPAVARRGKLLFSVSTSGASPIEAARIAGELLEQYGPEYEAYFDFLDRFRALVRVRVSDPLERRAIHARLAQLNLLDRVRNGRFDPSAPGWIERLAQVDHIRPDDLDGLFIY